MEQELEAEPRVATPPFGDRVAGAVEAKRSQLLVGLDPRPDLLPVELRAGVHAGRAAAAEACIRFYTGVIDAVAPYVVGAKPQLARFEALGADGMRVRGGLSAALPGAPGSSSSPTPSAATSARPRGRTQTRTWSAARSGPRWTRSPPAPISGAIPSSPRRRLPALGTGLFCLVKTSNSGSADIQDLALSDGRRVWHQVAELVAQWGEALVGERGFRASEQSSARPTRGRSGRRGG